MKKHIRAVASTTIRKPVEEVFQAFANPQYSVMVDPATVSAVLIGGEPFSKGAEYEVTIKAPFFLMKNIKEKQVYTEYDPPHRLTIDVSQDSMSGPENEIFDVAEDGAVTVKWIANYELRGMMAWLSKLIERMAQSKGQIWIDNMKQTIEMGRKPPE